MINFKYDDSTMQGTITLDGKLTIENLAELKILFIDAMSKTDHLVIDHTKTEEFDFSYLQFLISVIKTTEQLKKKLTVVKDTPESFRRLLIKSGFADINMFSRIFLN